MRNVAIAAVCVFASACYAEIEGTYDVNPRDHDISFRYTTPIATGQVGRNWVIDGCFNELDCTEQQVGVMNVAVDHPEVLMPTPTTGAKTWDATALAAGSATVSVMADNDGVERRGIQVVEVLDPDKVELVPAGMLARGTSLVAVPRTCAMPYRFTPNGLGTFAYKMMAGTKTMKGSGYYPFVSEELALLQPFDRGADGGGIQFIAGATPATSTITSMIPNTMGPAPIEIANLNPVTVTLSDQQMAPAGGQEHLFWAEIADTDKALCFDNNTRVIASMTPSICVVSDSRHPSQQYKGPGPYVINWLAAGTCTITVQIQGTTITTTKNYTPI